MSLFPSSLIIAASPAESHKKILEILESFGHSWENNPDLFIFQKMNIDEVRNSQNFLFKKPYSHNSKIIVIPDAQDLNLESQNALLKTLEEPGENNYILLTTTQPARLLSTILSRCHKIKIKKNSDSKKTQTWPISNNIKKDLALAPTLYSDKNEIKTLLNEQLTFLQQSLVDNPNKTSAKKITSLIHALEMIEANVDPKSALDWYLLN